MPTDMMSFIQGPLFLIVLMVAMFAILIIPQRRRDKKVRTMLDSIKEGDRVRTIGGFYGKIIKSKPDIVTIECGPDKVKLHLARSAIASVETSEVENDNAPA